MKTQFLLLSLATGAVLSGCASAQLEIVSPLREHVGRATVVMSDDAGTDRSSTEAGSFRTYLTTGLVENGVRVVPSGTEEAYMPAL